MGVLHIL
jgi:hypothetical protein